MAQRHFDADRREAPRFIGSLSDGPDQVVIEVRGDLDADMLDRLADHVNDAFSARQRFLTIDVSEVTRSVPGLRDLLGRTQRRLARRHGLLTVRGFRPHLLLGVDLGVGAGRSPRPEPVRTRTPSRRVPS